MSEFLEGIKKLNPYADFLDENEYSEIKDYISTGSLSVNSIMTGDMFKGIPSGRITALEGESGVGKSFIAGKASAEAQKKGYNIIWFDSEFATDKFFLQRLGVDASKVMYLPVDTVEEFRNQTFKILESLEEAQKKNPDLKVMIVLDSLGNLSYKKEMNDLEEGKDAQDMGQKAKIIKSMCRVLKGLVGRTQTPMIIINHGQWSREKNPNVPSKFQPTGGLGVIYLAHIRLLLSKSLLKEGGDENGKGKILIGNTLGVETLKNRLVPEGKRAKMLVNFETGVNKYFGLLEYAEKSGMIEKDGTRWYVKHLDKKIFGVNMYESEIFEPMLDGINSYIQEHCKFSSVSDSVLKKEVETETEEVETEEKKTRKYNKKKK